MAGLFASTARPLEYYGPRKSGMGGAGVAVLTQRESAFYNPASIILLDEGVVFPLIQGSFMYDEGLPTFIQAIGDSSSEGDQTDQEKIEDISKYIPMKLAAGFNTSLTFINHVPTASFMKGFTDAWSFNGYVYNKIGGNVVNLISPRVEVIGLLDVTGPNFTIAKRLSTDEEFFLKNPLAGLTIKRINRISLYNTDDGSELVSMPLLGMINGNSEFAVQ